MPRPHRRAFLRRSLAASGLVALGSPTIPGFLGRTALAARQDPARGRRVLVVVQLLGGNDGLNTVVPHKVDGYDRARRALRLPAGQLHAITPEIAFHPSLGGFARLVEAGRLAVVQGIGYPNPDRSHFRSMEIWETARVDTKPDTLDTGWLGRALDARRALDGPGADLPALHLGGNRLPLALKAKTVEAASVSDLDQFNLNFGGGDAKAGAEALRGMAARPSAAGDDDPLLGFVRRSTLAAYDSSARLEEVAATKAGSTTYPTSGLASRLERIARLIRADFATPIYYTTLDGFDTHANQLGSHAALLTELGDALAAFDADLKDAGQADRVAVLVFSEFGRRVAENASAGTDHGAAAPAFLAGPVATAGLVGAHPSLDPADLDDGDLKHHTDFRRLYACLLANWLGLDPAPILGPGFDPLPLLAAIG